MQSLPKWEPLESQGTFGHPPSFLIYINNSAVDKICFTLNLGFPLPQLQFSRAKMQNLSEKNRKTQGIKRKTREWNPKMNIQSLGAQFHNFLLLALSFYFVTGLVEAELPVSFRKPTKQKR